MQEIWKEIPEFKDKYIISNLGNIYSKVKKQFLNTSRLNKNGYKEIRLCAKTRKYRFIHRLIAETFIPNPFNYSQVNHINGIKIDNRIENLEWCSAIDNITHAFDTGLRKNYGEKCHLHKLSQTQVSIIKSSSLTNRELSSAFNVHITTIQRIRKGKIWNRTLNKGLKNI